MRFGNKFLNSLEIPDTNFYIQCKSVVNGKTKNTIYSIATNQMIFFPLLLFHLPCEFLHVRVLFLLGFYSEANK